MPVESTPDMLDEVGGMMDTATGLLYIGNGQYYDLQTGKCFRVGNQGL
jgi:hypothetical protein